MKSSINALESIFRKGSTTYYNSTLLFPRAVREDVTRLYAFVRVFDDLVDSVPQRAKEFYEMRDKFELTLDGKSTDDVVLTNFVGLMREREFKKEWVDAFLDAMESDLKKKVYYTIDETLSYMYGSAEVVGLMMMKVLHLREESAHYARMLGRAMQYLNFIRDLREDLNMGRQYLPVNEMEEFGLKDFEECNDRFREFMRFQLDRFMSYQREAEKGYRMIPSRYLIPIKTAADMYKWTGMRIFLDPCVVNKVKVKPKRRRILARGLFNFIGVPIWSLVSSYRI
ncbi:phytoene/squalene synthase family protein [Metallosphaera tengchongensis]|uniref:Phytoene/squalene synthase family protein n=1 Tax=Metallosphaera tengchongensis TaxID=1532350 RepID=A0A6N0NUY4_9CREN|nr:phytoene/squalene synthase family protein [Metallosphaera tengchongensis]QKR00664.1 phytoene/squalene synthase family protein [Metallosphaera tengchongensis]